MLTIPQTGLQRLMSLILNKLFSLGPRFRKTFARLMLLTCLAMASSLASGMPPEVTITNPTTSDYTYVTEDDTIDIAGRADDIGRIAEVSWILFDLDAWEEIDSGEATIENNVPFSATWFANGIKIPEGMSDITVIAFNIMHWASDYDRLVIVRQGNQPTFDLTQSSYNVDEGAGVATIGVTMSCASGINPNSASVSYSSSNGTATAGSSGSLGDYTAVNDTLTWGASGCGTTQTFNVPIQEDAIVEGNETVNLSLSNGNTAVLTILDNEPPLAVHLDYLAATAENGSIILEWTTGVEIDSAGFHILRANMGQFGEYTNITQITTDNMIDAKGESYSSIDYSYVDHDVVSNTTYYYALEEVDFDGKSTYHLDYIISGTTK